MHVSFGRQFDLSEGTPELRLVEPASFTPITDEPPARYGAARRPNWAVIAAIIALHLGVLAALTALDVIPLTRRPKPPALITLLPEQIVPPPHAAAPPPSAKDVPPPQPETPVQPQIIATPTASPTAPQIAVPPPAPAPVAQAPAPAPAVIAPPAPPAPIVPPDASAATLHNPPPVYPAESRRRHEQGTVRLRVVITPEGRVKDIDVAHSSGFDRLDQAALDAVKRWRFQPGTQAGVPVEAVGALSIPFRLT